MENLSSETDEKVFWSLSLLYAIESLSNKLKENVCGVPLSYFMPMVASLSAHQDEYIAYWAGKFMFYILSSFDYCTKTLQEYIESALSVFYILKSDTLHVGYIKHLKGFVETDKYSKEIDEADIFKYLPNSESICSVETRPSITEGNFIVSEKEKLMRLLDVKLLYKDQYVALSKQKK